MSAARNIYMGERFGRERCGTGTYPRHRHDFQYICVVLSGRFIESGDLGRFRVCAGDVLVHRSFEAHMDVFGWSAVDVLNLPLVESLPLKGLLQCFDLDAVAIMAESDPVSAAKMVARTSREGAGEQDWPDILAKALNVNPALSITKWADAYGLAPATVSRGFRQAYGSSPARFRAENRARQACRAVTATTKPLAEMAAEMGFADQAHMTRAVRGICGLPPARLRALGSS